MAYKQHFIEWFSGKQLPSYWTMSETEGTATMQDAVDGGFKLVTNTATRQNVKMNFNNKRQYSQSGSVYIAVGKDFKTTSSGSSIFGFFGDIGDDLPNNSVAYQSDLGSNKWLCVSRDTSTHSTDSTKTLDTDFHTFKIENKASSIEYSVDGSLDITKSGSYNQPASTMQPALHVSTGGGGGTESASIRYMECYNT